MSNNIDKVDVRSFTSDINDKYRGVEILVSRLEQKFSDLEESIGNKFEKLKLDARSDASRTLEDNSGRVAYMEKQINVQENEVSLL